MDVNSATELVHRRAGEEVTARLLASVGEGESLVVSGSLIEGLGNQRSDLDFFLLSNGYPRDVPVRMAFAGQSWIDIEYVTPGAVESLGARVGAIDPKDVVRVLHLSHKELDRYYRLAIGVTLEGPYRCERVLPLDTFRSLLKPWAIAHAGAFAARAVIALSGGDLTAAALHASQAAHFCLEGVLTDAGELYPSLKYTTEKAIRAYGADSAEARAAAALLHPSEDLTHYVTTVADQVDVALAGCLPAADSSPPAQPVSPLACSTHFSIPTLLTRKTAFDILPEDTAVVADLLSPLDLAPFSACPPATLSTWQAGAHRLVVREALVDAGIMNRTGDAQ